MSYGLGRHDFAEPKKQPPPSPEEPVVEAQPESMPKQWYGLGRHDFIKEQEVTPAKPLVIESFTMDRPGPERPYLKEGSTKEPFQARRITVDWKAFAVALPSREQILKEAGLPTEEVRPSATEAIMKAQPNIVGEAIGGLVSPFDAMVQFVGKSVGWKNVEGVRYPYTSSSAILETSVKGYEAMITGKHPPESEQMTFIREHPVYAITSFAGDVLLSWAVAKGVQKGIVDPLKGLWKGSKAEMWMIRHSERYANYVSKEIAYGVVDVPSVPTTPSLQSMKAEYTGLSLGEARHTAILDPLLIYPQEIPITERLFVRPQLPFIPEPSMLIKGGSSFAKFFGIGIAIAPKLMLATQTRTKTDIATSLGIKPITRLTPSVMTKTFGLTMEISKTEEALAPIVIPKLSFAQLTESRTVQETVQSTKQMQKQIRKMTEVSTPKLRMSKRDLSLDFGLPKMKGKRKGKALDLGFGWYRKTYKFPEPEEIMRSLSKKVKL